MAQLLRRETSCCELPRSGFTNLSSIPGQGKIMNVPVVYHKVIMEVIMVHHSSEQSGAEHRSLVFLGDPLN